MTNRLQKVTYGRGFTAEIVWLYSPVHDDVIKWKYFPRYWPFVREIHRSPVNFPHKGQWRGALMFTLICARKNGWVNNGEAGDLRRYLAHYDVIVMFCQSFEDRIHRWNTRTLTSNELQPCWCHEMETFSALLAFCAGNSPVTGEFPAQKPVTRSFDVFFDLQLNGRLSKQSWGWWFETPSRPLWRHSNGDLTLRQSTRDTVIKGKVTYPSWRKQFGDQWCPIFNSTQAPFPW